MPPDLLQCTPPIRFRPACFRHVFIWSRTDPLQVNHPVRRPSLLLLLPTLTFENDGLLCCKYDLYGTAAVSMPTERADATTSDALL